MLPEIKKILYATDLSPEAPYVFRYAMSQARSYQAKLYIFHAVEPLGGFARSLVEHYVSHEKLEQLHQEAKQGVIDKIRQRLEKFCEKELCQDYSQQEIVSDILIEEGIPGEAIVQQAQKTGADLIVMGTHRHLMGGGLIGSTARRVINISSIPVLVVRPPKEYAEDLDSE